MTKYLLAYLGLVALLALTYSLSFLSLGDAWGTAAGLLVGLGKTLIIVRVFMEFGKAGRIARVWFGVGLAWVMLLATILFDYAARPWDARPKSWTPRSEERVIGSGPDAGAPTPLGGR